MQKQLFILGICLAMAACCLAQDSSNVNTLYNLRQCVEIALQNNVDVKTAQFTMEGSKVNWEQSKGAMLPNVSGGVNHYLNQGRSLDPVSNSYISQNYTSASYGLNVSVVLWNASSIQNAIRQYRLAYNASQMDYQQQKDNTTISVILAYLTVLNNQEQLNMAVKQADVTRAQVERFLVMDKDGAVAPGDLYNMKGQLGTNELTVVNTRNALRSSQLNLTQLLNVPFTAKFSLAPISVENMAELYEGGVDLVYETAVHNLSLVKSADLKEQSAVKGIRAAEGQMYPVLSLGGSAGTNYSSVSTTRGDLLSKSDVLDEGSYAVDGSGNKNPIYVTQSNYASDKISYFDQWKNNFNTGVYLGLQIPILNGFTTRSRVRQAKINEKQTSFLAQTTRIKLRQSIEQAYVDMMSAFDRYKSYAQQAKDYGESFHAAQVKFDAGAITTVDYNIAKNNVDQASLGLISAKYDYILRTKVLDYYQGKALF